MDNISHKYFSVIWYYLKAFAKNNGLSDKDINIFDQLALNYPANYKHPLAYFTDQSQKSAHDVFAKCLLKARDIARTPNFFRQCGHLAADIGRISPWSELASTYLGPGDAYENLNKILADWKNVGSVDVLSSKHDKKSASNVKTTMKYTVDSNIPLENMYGTGLFLTGLLESLPKQWARRFWKPWEKLPPADVKTVMVPYDPVRLFAGVFFKAFELYPSIDGTQLSIWHQDRKKRIVIGRRVYLVKTRIGSTKTFTGDYSRTDDDGTGNTGFIITRNVEIDGEIICVKGTIFHGPHFIFEIENEETLTNRGDIGIRRHFKVNKVVLNEVLENTNVIREEIIKKERENKKLKEKQKKIIDEGKSVFENQISGGFVHEVRNSLVGSQLALSSLDDYDGFGKSAKQIFDELVNRLAKVPGLDQQTGEDVALLKKLVEDYNLVLLETEKAIESVLTLTYKIRLFTKAVSLRAGSERVGMYQVISSVAQRQNRLFEKNGIQFALKGKEVYVKGDKSVFISIFENIILNAIDAVSEKMSTGGKIVVTLQMADDIVVSVKDNGIGIQTQNISKIFDLFYTDKTSGSGLGLPIVKRFINIYGGTLAVKSKFGLGTEIIVRFNQSIVWREDEQTISDYGGG